MNKRVKKKYHKRYLYDVMLEISQDSIWRERIFKSQYNERFLITYERINDIPLYLKEIFLKFKLKYFISKVEACQEYFDNELVIFKIEAAEIQNLIAYSGN